MKLKGDEWEPTVTSRLDRIFWETLVVTRVVNLTTEARTETIKFILMKIPELSITSEAAVVAEESGAT